MEPLSTTRDAYKLFDIIRVENIYTYRLLYAVQFAYGLVTYLFACLACLEHRRPIVNTRNPDKWVFPHIPRFC